MLRILRGQRHAKEAAQPGQRAHERLTDETADAPAKTTAGALGETPAGSTAEAAVEISAGSTAATATEMPVSSTAQAAAETPASAAAEPAAGEPGIPTVEPGFLDRGRMRRRARFLRAARELAYRDLGGLIFDLHRFGQRNDEVVAAKLDTLARIDTELRTHEAALRERRPVTVLREAGVAACPRCAAIHGSGDRFCPACGLAVDQAERPVTTHSTVLAPSAPAAAPHPYLPAPPFSPSQAPPQVAPAVGPAAPTSDTDQATPAPAPPAPAAPVPAAPPAPTSDTPQAPPTPATPMPAAPVPAAPAAPTSDTDQATPAPATPAPAPPAPAAPAPEPATEVIRAAPESDRPPAQRTVAFDPLSRPSATVPRARESQEQEPRRP